jgi:sulfate/thiosulfate transport system substrate-binding protein
MSRRSILVLVTLALAALTTVRPAAAAEVELLNVSYDPTRELWRALNDAFIQRYKAQTGGDLTIKMSHGGSVSQARSVIDGLEADVVSLALWPDTDAIRKVNLVAGGWENRLPHGSVAYQSTIVFVVRRGNPKGIEDWPDLVKEGVEIVTPNPKTSGNGKLSFLAAWGSVTQRGGSEEQARELVTKLYQHAPVLDPAARGSNTTFAQKEIGDVHLTWENEAHLELKEFPGKLEIVYPPISILAEPPLAWVDANVGRKGTREAAEAYLKFLFTPEGQEIIAENFYRPTDPEVRTRHGQTFPDIRLFPVTAVGEGWGNVNARFFADGGVFDAIYAEGRK